MIKLELTLEDVDVIQLSLFTSVLMLSKEGLNEPANALADVMEKIVVIVEKQINEP